MLQKAADAFDVVAMGGSTGSISVVAKMVRNMEHLFLFMGPVFNAGVYSITLTALAMQLFGMGFFRFPAMLLLMTKLSPSKPNMA